MFTFFALSLISILIDNGVNSTSSQKFCYYQIHYVNEFSVGIIILRTYDTCQFRSYEIFYLSSYFFILMVDNDSFENRTSAKKCIYVYRYHLYIYQAYKLTSVQHYQVDCVYKAPVDVVRSIDRQTQLNSTLVFKTTAVSRIFFLTNIEFIHMLHYMNQFNFFDKI